MHYSKVYALGASIGSGKADLLHESVMLHEPGMQMQLVVPMSSGHCVFEPDAQRRQQQVSICTSSIDNGGFAWMYAVMKAAIGY